MTFLDKLLNYFNLSKDDYVRLCIAPSFSLLPSYTKFKDIDKIVNRIKLAITIGEKIIIYGDYDCDGIMATSILKKTFIMLGYPVDFYLPSRYKDGYGLTVERVNKYASQNYNLIITVDNGISQNEAIEVANKAGIDVIITDHHEVIKEVPNAYAIMHPLFSEYGETVSCGAYVAYMLSVALLEKNDEYLATLAAIATISDMMPLALYNRDIVRLGLKFINENHYYALAKLAEGDFVDEEIIAMRIAPKLNAIGRMCQNEEINVLVEYLTTDNKTRINEIYAWILDVNEARKKTMSDAFLKTPDVDLSLPAIVANTNEKEGLIGLIAARYLNSYDKVTIVFTPDSKKPNILKGSARSKPGFSIVKAFTQLKDYLLTYGGHECAGGCSLDIKDLPAFRDAFVALAKEYRFIEQKKKTIPISISDLTWENYEVYEALGPYGQGFERPYFKIESIDPNKLTFTKNGLHIITNITNNIKIVGFNFSYEHVHSVANLTLVGHLGINEFRNTKNLQFIIDEIEELA